MIQIATTNRSAVLMARIVDQGGRTVPLEQVESIAYMLFDVSTEDEPLAVEEDVEWLAVDEVMFDSLQLGESWALDACGYNFRHEIEFPPTKRKRSVVKSYVAAYLFRSVEGAENVIHFELKGVTR